jgi:hypothetical protein
MKISVCRFALSAMLLIMVATGVANAQRCSSSITMCGCTIASPGDYTVDADLNAAQGLTARGDCIDVAAKKVRLLTNGFAISGQGKGAGIHLLPSADDVFLEGFGGMGASFRSTALIGWQYGLESEASNVVSDGFVYIGNTVGVLLKGAQDNSLNQSAAFGNLVYGYWVKGGARNQIRSSAGQDNGTAGIYLGCSSTGPTGRACEEDSSTTSGNSIYESSGSSSAQNYGIAVERGSKRNTIVVNSFEGHTAYDFFDGNPNCDDNLWRVNHSFFQFATVNRSCIQ